ncbi:putative iron-sulfur cluster-binding metallochaperone [Ornithinibacillus californiensis]|uniref:putative iron-sulfur cluster-binding metallochaperone n=1 Tax=Ornithinibacillus californiensis TaxID=161536 RepID=UPI00064DC23B|nr:copper chaperone Copz family protein [Ornithinibacillus californiensis]
MSDCCTPEEQVFVKSGSGLCPSCNTKGKKVKIITLKSLLRPLALEAISPDESHYFCTTKECDAVYFESTNKTYLISDLKVSVHQKDDSVTTPICYCFDWTKEKIEKYIKQELSPNPLEHIKENVQADRCGCEVNNPQGSCCMGNVTKYIKSLS